MVTFHHSNQALDPEKHYTGASSGFAAQVFPYSYGRRGGRPPHRHSSTAIRLSGGQVAVARRGPEKAGRGEATSKPAGDVTRKNFPYDYELGANSLHHRDRRQR